MVEGHYDDGRLLLENMKMPVLFIGHGNPMNAIEENEFSLAWQEAARHLPQPKAILILPEKCSVSR